jgi:PAS domain S-box-containing protein
LAQELDDHPQASARAALVEAAVANMDHGVVAYDKDLIVRVANQRSIDLLDVPAELLKVGADITEVVRHAARRGDYGPGDRDEQVRNFLAVARGKEPFRFERLRPDGARIEIRGIPLPAGGHVATYTDVSEMNRIASALGESEGRLQAVTDNVAEALITIDETGRIEFANPAAERMYGYERSELLGGDVAMLMPETERGRHRSYVDHYLRTGQAKILGIGPREVSARRKDGSTFAMELMIGEMQFGERRLLVGSMRDVSERHRAEAERAALGDELEHKNFLLDTALDNMGHAVAMFDADLRLVICNRDYIELTSLSPEYARPGTPLADIIDYVAGAQRVDDATRKKAIERRLALARSRQEAVFREYFADGRVIKVLHRPLEDGGSLATYLDITEELAAEKDLRIAKEQAELASRAKSEFLANMSHELRTPLNAIIGFSEMIRESMFGPVGNAKYQEYVSDIHSSGEHLRELINDILDLSKIEAGKQELHEEVVDVTEVIGSCFTLVDGRARDAVLNLERCVPERLCGLWVDKRSLKQVLLNLLSNAVKFTPAGGRVSVTAGIAPDRHFEIVVADTGIGIAADDIPKVLEPFQQVDSTLSRRYEGTGLGLPLSKAMVEKNGGTLEIDSTVDAGTTVKVRFPPERARDLAA